MYLVKLTDVAEEDILQTVNYIADVLKSPIAANKLLDLIEEKEKILSEMPNIYPFVPDEHLAKKGLKFTMVKNYMIFYTVNELEKKVDVIRFLYGHRDWMNILKEEK